MSYILAAQEKGSDTKLRILRQFGFRRIPGAAVFFSPKVRKFLSLEFLSRKSPQELKRAIVKHSRRGNTKPEFLFLQHPTDAQLASLEPLIEATK